MEIDARNRVGEHGDAQAQRQSVDHRVLDAVVGRQASDVQVGDVPLSQRLAERRAVLGPSVERRITRALRILALADDQRSRRESQIGIVVGTKGEMLKRIGTHARKEIEAMSGRKVHLELRVKVRKNWRSDPGTLKNFGFSK